MGDGFGGGGLFGKMAAAKPDEDMMAAMDRVRDFSHISYYYAMVTHTRSVQYWKCCSN